MLAQAERLADPSTWEQFGPFGVVFVVMTVLGMAIISGLIYALRKAWKDGDDREAAAIAAGEERVAAAVAAGEARVKAIISERDAERTRTEAAQRDLLALHERLVPLVERVGPTIEANTALIRMMQEGRS